MIHETMPLMLHGRIGEAELGDNRYELLYSEPLRTPIVRNMNTGKTWTVTWERLVDMAIEEGLNVQ